MTLSPASRVSLALGLLILVQAPGAAADHNISVSVLDGIDLPAPLASKIINRAERLICDACTDRRRRQTCQIKLRLNKVTHMARGSSVFIGTGRMSRNDVN